MKIEKHRKRQIITSFDTNRDKRLKLNSLFQHLSEIAWEHAKILGVGFEDFHSTNRFWVLNSISVEVNKMPVWQDEVELVTWPSGLLKLFFTREFEVLDKDGEILVKASSTWLIVDRKSMRPIIPRDYDYLEKYALEKTSLTGPVKIEMLSSFDKVAEIRSEYTDIDMHQHVNNSVFIRWIENSISCEVLKDSYYFGIQFIKEMKVDQIADVLLDKNSNKFEIKNSDNKTHVRAIFKV